MRSRVPVASGTAGAAAAAGLTAAAAATAGLTAAAGLAAAAAVAGLAAAAAAAAAGPLNEVATAPDALGTTNVEASSSVAFRTTLEVPVGTNFLSFLPPFPSSAILYLFVLERVNRISHCIRLTRRLLQFVGGVYTQGVVQGNTFLSVALGFVVPFATRVPLVVPSMFGINSRFGATVL